MFPGFQWLPGYRPNLLQWQMPAISCFVFQSYYLNDSCQHVDYYQSKWLSLTITIQMLKTVSIIMLKTPLLFLLAAL